MENNDLQDWARHYLDLWQDRMTVAASEPNLLSAMCSPLIPVLPERRVDESESEAQLDAEVWQATFAAWLEAFRHALSSVADSGQVPEVLPSGSISRRANDRSSNHKRSGRRVGSATPGPSTAAVSPGNGRSDLDDIARRLADLEARIAALDTRAGGAGGQSE